MSERLPQNIVPIHYDLYIHVTPRTSPFNATVTISFKKNQDDDKVTLYIGSNLSIVNITQCQTKLKYTIDYPKLIIFLSPSQNISSSPITIDYLLTPNSVIKNKGKKGFYLDEEGYYTQFEPNYAQEMLPCFDDPCIKSTFTITIQIPSNLTGLSNMPAENTQIIGDEKKIKFYTTPPMCTYLLCISIGDFQCIEGKSKSGIPIKLYAKSGRQNLLEEFLHVAVFSFDWCEEKFGVKYELPILQILSCNGHSAGMENYGLIAFKEFKDFPDNVKRTIVIMHEISHLWFGDLVSVEWWDSAWIKEGFAQFFQYRIFMDSSFEEYKFAIDHFLKRDGFPTFELFLNDTVIPSEIDFSQRVLKLIIYRKGSYIVKMFYDLIGEENFFKVCNSWISQYRNKSADTNDFITVVNNVLNSDYSSFFNPWLRKEGCPTLEVVEMRSEENPNKITGIKLSQKYIDNTIFKFKISIAFQKADEKKKIDLVIKDEVTVVDVDFDWIVVNDQVQSLCCVIYSKFLLEKLIPIKDELGKFNNKLIYLSPQLSMKNMNVDKEICELCSQFDDKQ